MTPPRVRINTFVQTQSRILVDTLSMLYIIAGLPIGINRVPIVTKKYIFIIPSLFYSVLYICGVLYLTVEGYKFDLLGTNILTAIMSYLFCVLYNIIFYKKMRRYYIEINKFDVEVGCRPKTARLSLRCYVQMCVLSVYNMVLFFGPHGKILLGKLLYHILFAHLAINSELHYYGHAVSLLLPRLRLIKYYMQLSLSTSKDVRTAMNKEYIFFKNYNESANSNMKKIMDLYYTTFKIYNYLNAAIKWQLLMIIILSFISVLGFCYHFSLNIIRGQNIVNNMLIELGLALSLMIPLFAPCVSADNIQSEVRRLRELIASRLYKNKLDKSSRSIARALLEFTENRDLSFRLMRILDVGISLPFKFVGLLVTYLIILMQFEKVLNPS